MIASSWIIHTEGHQTTHSCKLITKISRKDFRPSIKRKECNLLTKEAPHTSCRCWMTLVTPSTACIRPRITSQAPYPLQNPNPTRNPKLPHRTMLSKVLMTMMSIIMTKRKIIVTKRKRTNLREVPRRYRKSTLEVRRRGSISLKYSIAWWEGTFLIRRPC